MSVQKRIETVLSPWVRLVEKTVDLPGRPAEVYHCLAQNDYVTIIAQTPAKQIAIVRQYRPAVECVTCELPAGLLEPGEDPETACRRELLEEVGLVAHTIRALGQFYPDTGRLENTAHVFWVNASAPDPNFCREVGIQPDFVTFDELRGLIFNGAFRHQLHIGALGIAWLNGLVR